jgi:hypothetical protein
MPVRPVGRAVSPLDEGLGLSGSRYSRRVQGWLVRLGAELPFARAAFWLEELTGVVLSASTVRRQTEAVGATAVALAEAEVERLERETPTAPCRPERLAMGADGAMVPLVGGEWAEVKLVSVGVPTARGEEAPDRVKTAAPPLREISYFARLADAETFGRQALGELHRRGLEAAGAVAAVQDGAPWLQGFVDLHRPDALRILDWPHAAQHLTALCATLFGEGTARAQRVGERLRRWLWEEGPARVLAILAGWERARPELTSAVAYFRERRAQLVYPTFRAAGWPVGSGATESGHKQVMQARMKRAGMRWARAHVNPLLALTLLEHNARWASDGAALLTQHRRRSCRRPHQRPCHLLPQREVAPVRSPSPPRPPIPPVPASAPPQVAAPSIPARVHPWRRYGWLSRNK